MAEEDDLEAELARFEEEIEAVAAVTATNTDSDAEDCEKADIVRKHASSAVARPSSGGDIAQATFFASSTNLHLGSNESAIHTGGSAASATNAKRPLPAERILSSTNGCDAPQRGSIGAAQNCAGRELRSSELSNNMVRHSLSQQKCPPAAPRPPASSHSKILVSSASSLNNFSGQGGWIWNGTQWIWNEASTSSNVAQVRADNWMYSGQSTNSLAGAREPSLDVRVEQNDSAIGENRIEDRRKRRNGKDHRRTAAGEVWVDPTLGEWPADDFRIFVGDLAGDATVEDLTEAFRKYSSFNMARVVADKRTGECRGYGFVSFSKGTDMVAALKEMNGKYVGSRPVKLKKSTWQKRELSNERRKRDLGVLRSSSLIAKRGV